MKIKFVTTIIMVLPMEELQLFECNFKNIINDGVHFLQLETSSVKDSANELKLWEPNPNCVSCSICKIEFTDFAQRELHYKTDWHRYNLRQSIWVRSTVTEEVFKAKGLGQFWLDDMPSTSESESDEDSMEDFAAAHGKLFLKTSHGRVLSIYRCLIFNKKEELENEILLSRLFAITANTRWTLLMLGGGHFSGGVFLGNEAVVHKTSHFYTVRAGQGGVQTARDNRSSGSHPKSAGAALRRRNVLALIQDVRNILELWKEDIAKSSLIIYRAVGPYNKFVFFGGKTPPFHKSDTRLRTIPFSTGRPTFTELKRVHSMLTTLTVYESTDVALEQIPTLNKTKQKRIKTKRKGRNIHRSKSRDGTERPLPVDSADVDDLESMDEMDNIELTTTELEISFEDALQPFADSLSLEEKKTKKRKPKKSKNQRIREQEARKKTELYTIVKSGNLEKLKEILEQQTIEITSEDVSIATTSHQSEDTTNNILNKVLDEQGNTLLHVSALFEQSAMVKFLLEQNADPCNKNVAQQTPYTCTQDKEIRCVFKDFAQQNPDKHNYNKAQIPVTTMNAEEQMEKKKAQRKVTREKEKEKKIQNSMKKKEEVDKERFLNLSDREKRALAAERRILSQSGTVIARCYLCASDISGLVPFEYSGNRFCSIECLKSHRRKCINVLSV